MSDSEAHADAATDSQFAAEPGDWRLALRITHDEAVEDSSTKTVSRSKVDSGQDFAVEVLVENRVIAVFRHAGSWYALDGMCSHQGGPLVDGIVREGCVTCPWHGWQYDLATGIQMINRQPLQESFPIRQINDCVEVHVSRE